MAGRSILYLGSSDFAAEFCGRLKASASCGHLTVVPSLAMSIDVPEKTDLVMFEAGPAIAQSGQTLTSLIHALARYPLVAVACRDHEHRAIAAVRAGAQGSLCVDDMNSVELEATIDHATQRHRLLTRLSETDSTVLSILQSINDGVIVVDRHGHVLDINPAARSILGLAPRQPTDADWARSFCS
jgi:PAS domain-containing protein